VDFNSLSYLVFLPHILLPLPSRDPFSYKLAALFLHILFPSSPYLSLLPSLLLSSYRWAVLNLASGLGNTVRASNPSMHLLAGLEMKQ